ncbi:unnamed protein product [Calypogeia fissa]
MLGVARTFWRLFIKRAREFLETINGLNLKHYYNGVEIIARLEKLALHHTAKGEFDTAFVKFVDPHFIGGGSGWQELSLQRANNLQATGGPLDPPPVGPQKRPKSPRSPRRVEHERVEEPGVATVGGVTFAGPTHATTPPPDPVEVAPADGLTPNRDNTTGASVGVTNRPTTEVEGEGVSRQVEMVEPNQVEPITAPEAPVGEEGVINDVTAPKEMREGLTMTITRLTLAVVSTTRKPEHEQFWKDMGLQDFVYLRWGTTIGNDDECREFIRNSTTEGTVVGGDSISLSGENLARIF